MRLRNATSARSSTVVASRKSKKVLAKELSITEGTVKAHLVAIY